MTPVELLKQHIASISDDDEQLLIDRVGVLMFGRDPDADVADLAVRTCNCGRKIIDFYDYTDHLIEVLERG